MQKHKKKKFTSTHCSRWLVWVSINNLHNKRLTYQRYFIACWAHDRVHDIQVRTCGAINRHYKHTNSCIVFMRLAIPIRRLALSLSTSMRTRSLVGSIDAKFETSTHLTQCTKGMADVVVYPVSPTLTCSKICRTFSPEQWTRKFCSRFTFINGNEK